MRFGSKIDNRVDVIGIKQVSYQRLIANISPYKNVSLVIIYIGQVIRIARVRQQVEIDNAVDVHVISFVYPTLLYAMLSLIQLLTNEVAANEPAAAGHQKIHATSDSN
jgi:hypothetical protein